MKNYLMVGGTVIPRGSTELDLREKKLTAGQFEALRAELPDCRIRWNVPIGDAFFDSESEAVAVGGFTSVDIDNLSYFPGLTELDVRASDLSESDFRTLTAAVPDCHVLWSIPIGEGRFSSDAESIEIGGFAATDLALFDYFETLKTVDARGSDSYDAILALREARPELEILWQVPVSGTAYPQDAEELQIDSTTTSPAQLTEALGRLPAVTKVSVPECTYTTEEKLNLLAQFPEVQFQWPVTVAGKTFTGAETEISLAGASISDEDYEVLLQQLPALPQLQTVDLAGSSLTDEQVIQLGKACPDKDVLWEFEIGGIKISTLDTMVDLTGVPLSSAEEVERIFPCMHHLEKIDLTDCGLTDEELDALNHRHDNIRVVWTLRITHYNIRTDDIGFRATSSYYGYFTDETQERLRYCEDMLSLDIGHRPVSNLNFVTGMTHLKHLCMLDCPATDLTPVGELKELVWLEMPRTYITSIAPLVNCTGLKDLNFTFSRLESEEETFNTLMQMPWLERVWFGHGQLTEEHIATLQETYPDILFHEVFDWVLFCGDPWRYDQDYYDMRDNMNMFYMSQSGRINYKIIDGVRYDLDPEFLAAQGDTSHDKDR